MGKFETVKQLKGQVHEELKDIPVDSIADVGYFEGRQSSKIWLVTDKDVVSMYQKVKKDSEIFLVKVTVKMIMNQQGRRGGAIKRMK